MTNYYDELKNDILEVLEDKYSDEYLYLQENRDMPREDIFEYLYDKLFVSDAVTGNLSGSYYFSSYKSRVHCYSFFRDVEEALKEFEYKKDLERFKTFVSFVEEGYLDIENMTLNVEMLQEACDDIYYLEDIAHLNFEKLDVITRCYKLYEVLTDILENFF